MPPLFAESAVPGCSYARIIAPHDSSRKLRKISKRRGEDTEARMAHAVVTSPSGKHSWEDADGGQDQDSRERSDARNRCGAGYAAAVRARGRAAAARAAFRLRARAVRLMFGAGGWRGDALVRHAGFRGRGQIGHDARRPAGVVRQAAEASQSARAASRAAGHDRRAGRAVRLLLQRHDHQGRRAALENAAADRRRRSARR